MTENLKNSGPLIWITGAGGLIGNYLVQTAAENSSHRSIRPLTRLDLDLLDDAAVRRAFQSDRPGAILHCAAMSKSPECQQKPELAWKINTDATARLVELAADIPFIFLSSDLVFDGCKGNYTETDPPNPLGVYAETKVAAETVVLANPRHTVIRTSLNGGTSPTGDRGFSEPMRAAWASGQTLQMFTDEFRCPLPAIVTARAIWELLDRGATGLFHLAGSERLSRAQIAQLVAVRWPELNPKIEAVSRKGYQGAPRPADTSLNCAKVQKFLSFPLPGLSAWLAEHPDERF